MLGPLTRIGATVDRVTIPDQKGGGAFGVVGFDEDGFTAPIEPSDAELTYDTALLDIKPGEDGLFTATPRGSTGSTLVTVEVKGHTTVFPVSVGLEEKTIADFDDADRWRFGTARGSGKVEPVAEGHTGRALRLSYDFTQSTATRTAYAYPPAPIEIPGQPLALGAWVHGDEKGEWTAFTITDANGQSYSLYGPYITWKGWRQIEMQVPASVAYPIKVTRFYTIETSANRQYTGEVLIDDFTAEVPPPAQTPPAPERVPDPLVIQDGTADGSPWRFAVLSDAQFVAADPDSEFVRQARRTLREVLAAKPDFLVINGDFVDTGYEADFALAKKILDEELGGRLPYYYVPGNHEIYGPGDIGNFRKAFGEPSRTFDHKGTRFVLLDSSTGTYRTSSYAQLTMLRDALDGAARDRSVRSVMVFGHHPARDPLPSKNSQLADRKEAALLEKWTADFRARTGKGAAVVNAHVGVFHASRVDGVPTFVNGNSGKNPSGSPADGGFTGWTMFGVDPRVNTRGGDGWLRAEVRPHVDELSLTVPERVKAGTTAHVTATLRQDGEDMPLAYPMSADWSGSPNVHIGDARRALPWLHTVTFDPATGRLTALRPGKATLSVTVNGVRRQATITVTG
ncbi:metallophosphoesterase family protein [Actinomadura miaoliensis]|uniref:Calcineurin-like phosphoesterase domain-containing protein n=1 Tax=Actinomadura miaoliensis TaxID=430685 RepID=A0ABP7WKR4_9ACTN